MSVPERLALTVDLGTGGPKAALVSETGELVAFAVRSVASLRVGDAGAEQDPAELWSAVRDAVRETVDRAGSRCDSVVGVACVSQYSSIVPVDTDGNPTERLVLWRDGRGAPHGMALYAAHPDAVPTWIERSGVIPLPSGADSLSHMLFLKNERPEAWARTRYCLEAMDFLTMRLTGEATANHGSAFMMLLTDNRNPARLGWDSELMRMAGIAEDKLPRLVPMSGQVGALRAAVAEELGLPSGVPIFASMTDTQAAAIGTGAFLPGRGGLNVGTTAQVLAHAPAKATDFESHLVSVPSPVDGRYLVIAENGLGGGALRHLIEGLLFTDGALGDTAQSDPYRHVDRAVSTTRPGAGGVLFLPWLAGAQFPEDDPAMRGGFLGVSLDTRREELVRAVMEGVALNLCAMVEPVERFAGQRFERVAFSGGGALSEAWSQILADVSGKPVLQLEHARFVNNLAAALGVFRALGSAELDAVTEWVRVRRAFEPRAEYAGLYARLGEQLRKALVAVGPISHALG